MPLFKLKKLTVKNFRSFLDSEVVFSPEGMSLIRGFNLDTGGSSGAGKSTITGAIALALGFGHLPSKDQKSWFANGPMSVSLDFETPEGVWTVKRGDKSSLKPPSGPTITGSEAVDAKLRQIVGVDSEILSSLVYKKQHDRGMFLCLTDSGKKEFLAKVLGLEEIERACDESSELIRAQETKVGGMAFAVQQLETQLRGLPEPVLLNVVDTQPLIFDIKGHSVKLEELKDSEAASAKMVAEFEEKKEEIKKKITARYKAPLEEAQEKVRTDSLPTKQLIQNQKDEPLLGSSELVTARENLAAVSIRLDRLKKSEAERQASFSAQYLLVNQDISNTKSDVRDIPRVVKELGVKGQQIASLRSQVCPTCVQTWITEQAAAQLTRFLSEEEALKSKLSSLTVAQESLAQKEQKLAGMIFVPDEKLVRFQEVILQLIGDIKTIEASIRSEYEKKKAQQAALANEEISKAKIRLTESKLALAAIQADFVGAMSDEMSLADNVLQNYRNNLQTFRDAIHSVKTKKSESEMALRITEAENKARSQDFLEKLKARSEASSRLLAACGRLELEQTELSVEQDFHDFIGYKGFMGSIFEEVLSEVTEETNNILGAVANTAHVTLHFVSEVTSQKGGDPKREIKPMISVAGNVATLKSGCSGGMQTSIHLAVDLAVSKVVSRRTASYPGFLMLDESFDGLDLVSKEACMEMLSKNATDRLILLVDHSSEVKEAFTSFIDVEYTNGVSQVRG